MAWDTIGNVTKDAESVKAALESWETDVSPSSIDDFEVIDAGQNRVTITILYTA